MELTNRNVIVIALYGAGGGKHSIDIEHIADGAYHIAPSLFSWKYFPERIDLRTVQYALKNCAYEQPQRVQGSLRHGYQLTSEGIAWARKNISTTQGTDADDDRFEKNKSALLEAERHRLRQTTAYKKYSAGAADELTHRDYETFVRINQYFSERLRMARTGRISDIVNDDAELSELWYLLREQYQEGRKHG